MLLKDETLSVAAQAVLRSLRYINMVILMKQRSSRCTGVRRPTAERRLHLGILYPLMTSCGW